MPLPYRLFSLLLLLVLAACGGGVPEGHDFVKVARHGLEVDRVCTVVVSKDSNEIVSTVAGFRFPGELGKKEGIALPSSAGRDSLFVAVLGPAGSPEKCDELMGSTYDDYRAATSICRFEGSKFAPDTAELRIIGYLPNFDLRGLRSVGVTIDKRIDSNHDADLSEEGEEYSKVNVFFFFDEVRYYEAGGNYRFSGHRYAIVDTATGEIDYIGDKADYRSYFRAIRYNSSNVERKCWIIS